MKRVLPLSALFAVLFLCVSIPAPEASVVPAPPDRPRVRDAADPARVAAGLGPCLLPLAVVVFAKRRSRRRVFCVPPEREEEAFALPRVRRPERTRYEEEAPAAVETARSPWRRLRPEGAS